MFQSKFIECGDGPLNLVVILCDFSRMRCTFHDDRSDLPNKFVDNDVNDVAMPKQRLTSLDIHALSSELQSIVSYRLQNIYGAVPFLVD